MSKNNNAGKKSALPVKLIAIAAAVIIAVIAVIVIIGDGIPGSVRDEIEASVDRQIGYSVKSVDCEKKYKVEDSLFDKETMYLVSFKLKKGEVGDRLDGHYCLCLATLVSDGSEENISCSIIGTYEEKDSLKEAIKEFEENQKK